MTKCHHQEPQFCHRCPDAELSPMSRDITAGSLRGAFSPVEWSADSSPSRPAQTSGLRKGGAEPRSLPLHLPGSGGDGRIESVVRATRSRRAPRAVGGRATMLSDHRSRIQRVHTSPRRRWRGNRPLIHRASSSASRRLGLRHVEQLLARQWRGTCYPGAHVPLRVPQQEIDLLLGNQGVLDTRPPGTRLPVVGQTIKHRRIRHRPVKARSHLTGN
jgi:hypothetical protein